ncbi:MAG: right-handed parallel beta-helix repeat-containing protein [Candidatus Angelobacter sp.]
MPTPYATPNVYRRALFFLCFFAAVSGAQAQVKRADSCSADEYPGKDAGAKISAAIADARCSTIDAKRITGAQSAATPITIGRPVALLLGDVTLSVSDKKAIDIKSPEGKVSITGIAGKTKIVNTTGAAPGPASAMIIADYAGKSQAADITISNLSLDGGGNSNPANCYKRGIVLRNVTRAIVEGNSITGITVPAAGPGDAYSINFADQVTDSKILTNTISGTPGTFTDHGYRMGILVQSKMIDGYNGLVNGTPRLPATTTGILIQGNVVTGGTHGINLQNVSHVQVINNQASDQGHRNLIVYATSDHILVRDNTLRNAGSVNLLFDFGIDEIEIAHNVMDTTKGAEGDNIEGYLLVSHVNIHDNVLSNAALSGIKIAAHAKSVDIKANKISNFCNAAQAAGILVEGAMSGGYPTLASGELLQNVNVSGNTVTKQGQCAGNRPSYGVQVLGKNNGTKMGDVPMTGILIENNTFDGVSSDVAMHQNGDAAAWDVKTGKNTFIHH